MGKWKRPPRAWSDEEFRKKRELRELKKKERELRSRHRTYLGIGILLVVALLALSVYFTPWQASRPPSYVMVPPDSRFTGGQLIRGPLLHPLTFNSCTQDYRPDYGLSCDAQRAMFGRLPLVNKDLMDVTNATFWGMVNGGGVDLFSLPAAYWQQPEFYPSWGWDSTVRNMSIQNSYYWTPFGFSMYPGMSAFNISQSAANGQPVTLDVIGFFHAGFNVSTWQGVDVYPYFPASAVSVNGSTVFTQNPAQAAARIAFSIATANDSRYDALKSLSGFSTNLPPGGRFFLLGPTHANLTTGPTSDCLICSPWTVRLDIRLTVSTAQKGSYVLDIGSMNPNDWINQAFGSPTGVYRIGSYYVASGDWHGGYLMQVVLNVT